MAVALLVAARRSIREIRGIRVIVVHPLMLTTCDVLTRFTEPDRWNAKTSSICDSTFSCNRCQIFDTRPIEIQELPSTC